MSATILCVAEKPSIATTLGRLLGTPTASPWAGKQRLPVHETEGAFRGKRVKYRITSVAGHVYAADFPAEYQNWQTTEPRTLFGAPIVKKGERKVVRHLEDVSKGCDAVVLFLDCDREGENICFEVLGIVEPHLRGFAGKKVFRARFSSLTEEDVTRAMNNLVDPNYNEARAVDARQELDLKVGVAFTRFQTSYFSNKYGNLDSRLISYGPCQTPTLGFVVKRHDAIVTFQPRHWWSISLSADVNGSHVPLKWSQGRLFGRESVVSAFSRASVCKEVACLDVKKRPGRKQRPVALNTVELLRFCSKTMGIGPHETMRIAEELYIRGFLSYPRTESTSYPRSFDFYSLLKEHFTRHEIYGAFVTSLLEVGLEAARGGVDVGDHPPITPTRSASEHLLGGHLWRVYDYVARHFFASVSPDCVYEKLKASWDLAGEKFTSSTVEVLKAGYTLILPHEAITTTTVASSAPVTGTRYPVLECRIVEGDTEPPGHLTESELITLMEKNGIGTDASIPVHINNISERKFVRVTGNRELVPTPLGIHLIHGYNKIDPDLSGPSIRSKVESMLDVIAQGKASFESVVTQVLSMFVEKFTFFEANISRMDELFEVTFSTVENTAGKKLSKCGLCRRYMKLIQKLPMRLFCETCGETYALPPKGSIKLYQERVCPLDNFELVLWRGGEGAQARSFPVCPMCYNHVAVSAIEDGMQSRGPQRTAGMSCNECTVPTCDYSLVRNVVMPCEDGCAGAVVFDPTSGPKWKMTCTACNYAVFLPEAAKKIFLHPDDKCIDCGCTMMTVDFNKNTTPLPGGATAYTGCPLCDEVINSQCREGTTRITYGKKTYGGRRGKGAKGGGGRGGKKRPDPRLTPHGF